MEPLYPLKFRTIYKDKIWGGDKIKTILGKDFSPLPNCGETWEISGVKSDVSVVENGPLEGISLATLVQQCKEELVGKLVYKQYGDEFPLLVKFIDAADYLSIQVHPGDQLAKERHDSFGKTEMWYVVQADEDAALISGFSQPVNEDIYVEKLNSGKLNEIMNDEKVAAGDVFFLPAGRVHSIGKGLLIAEIQQTSDITYRIYDFDRVDDKGNKRQLHTEEALAAIDYSHADSYKTVYEPRRNEAVEVVKCPYFTTNVIDCTESLGRNYADLDSFKIQVCVSGGYTLTYEGFSLDVAMGDCILIPATVKEVIMETETGFKILESYIE